MKRRTNSAVARGIATAEPDADSWAAFDRLPRALREMLWGAPISINPLSIAPLVSDGGADYAVTITAGAIGDEMARFDRQHKATHGYQSPAVASGVRPLRYGDVLKQAVGPRPHRREVIRPRRRGA